MTDAGLSTLSPVSHTLSPPSGEIKASPVTDSQSYDDLDRWIEMLMDCKQLSENDVKKLCDKVY